MWTHGPLWAFVNPCPPPPTPQLLFSPGLLGFDVRVPLAAFGMYLEESAGSLQVGAECWQQVYGEASHLLRFLLVQVAELLLPIALCLGEELKNKTGRTFRYCHSASHTCTHTYTHSHTHTHTHNHTCAHTHPHPHTTTTKTTKTQQNKLHK